jgi:hypothetical protein
MEVREAIQPDCASTALQACWRATWGASRTAGVGETQENSNGSPAAARQCAVTARTVDVGTMRRSRRTVVACLLLATARGRQTRQSRAGGRDAQVGGRSLSCRRTSPVIHAGACLSARCGQHGHPTRLASRKLYASVSETFLTGAHGIQVKA